MSTLDVDRDTEVIKRLAVVSGAVMRTTRRKQCICCLTLILLFVTTLVLTQIMHQGFSPIGHEYKHDINTGQYWFGELVNFGSLIKKNTTTTCSPTQNIAFVKTHKTGSSTIANILMRYGIVNDLNFALPNTEWDSYGFNYISRSGEVMSEKYVYPLPEGEEYNILFNHAIYNRTAFRMIMPEDTVYITILREPFQQFVSTFEYYHIDQFVGHVEPSLINSTNLISPFLASPTKFLGNNTLFSYTKNKQAEDLGFGKEQFLNSTSLINYLSSIEKDFKLVMMLEHFDESLLLLKHELCWTLQDILYIPLNANKKKPMRNITNEDHENHRTMSRLDYILYYHFLEVFTQKLDAQTPDFFQELGHFKMLLKNVKESCETGTRWMASGTMWNAPFVIDSHECELLRMSVISGLELLYKRAGRVGKSGNESVIVRVTNIYI